MEPPPDGLGAAGEAWGTSGTPSAGGAGIEFVALDLIDWDEGGQYANGTYFPPPLAVPDSSELFCSEDSSNLVGFGGGGGAPYDAATDGPSPRGQSSLNTTPRSGSFSTCENGESPVEGRASTDAEKRRRRAIVAAASRVTRAKRKRERENLEERNKRLELDRETYLAQIALLQTEVQMLRDGGAINLEKENELLRTEIRKHKAFIYNIVSATAEAPSTTEEEKYRFVKSGSDSAIGQVVGLAYTSVADPSWFSSSLKPSPDSDMAVPVRVQVLPLGCEIQNAKRVNLRLDMPDRPEDIAKLRDKLYRTWTEPELVRRFVLGISGARRSAHLKEIETNFSQVDASEETGGNNMRVFHYTEEDTDAESVRDGGRALAEGTSPARAAAKVGKCDAVFVLTWKWTRTFDHSFPDLKGSAGAAGKPYGYETALEGDKVDAHSTCVLCSATTINEHDDLQPQQDGTQRISSPMIEGHILRRNPAGGTRWTVCYSLPVGGDSYAGLSAHFDGPLVNADGTLGRVAQQTIKIVLDILDELD